MNSVVEPSVKKQYGRASPLLPLLGRRPHVVVLSGMNDTKCDLERKDTSSIKVHVSCKDRSIYMKNTWDWNYETNMHPGVDVRTCVT